MSPSYWKLRKQKRIERSRKGVEARERKRLANAEAAETVGTITFDGPMFGGRHTINCQICGEGPLLLTVDERPFKPMSYRGVLRLIARRLTR